MAERLHFHALEKEMATHSSVLCPENPRDGGAWWAAVYGVAQSRTRLKRLSSSNSTLAISSLPIPFALIHGPDIPDSYAILLFTASDLASITSHIHSWVLFLLLLHPFILSRVISPLISSSILGTY